MQPIRVNRIDFASIEIRGIYDRSDFVVTLTIPMGYETLFVDARNQSILNANQKNTNKMLQKLATLHTIYSDHGLQTTFDYTPKCKRKRYFVYENQTKYTFSIKATTRLAHYPNENKKRKQKKLSIEKYIVPTK